MKNTLSFILIISLLCGQQAAYGAAAPNGWESSLEEQVHAGRQNSAAQLRERVFALAEGSRASVHSESWLNKLDRLGRPDCLEETKRAITRYSLSAKKPRYTASSLRYYGAVLDMESGETSGIYPAEMLGPSVPMARAIEQLVTAAPTERTLLALEVLLRKPDLHELPFLYTVFGAAAIVSPANASENLSRLSSEQLSVLRENLSRELAFIYSYNKRLGPVDLEYDRQLRNQAAQLLWGLDARNRAEYPFLQEPKKSITFWEQKDEITAKVGAGMLVLSLLSLGRVRVCAGRVPSGMPKMSIKAGTGTVKPLCYERGSFSFKPVSAGAPAAPRVSSSGATPRVSNVYEGNAALNPGVREIPSPAPMKVLRPQMQPVQAAAAVSPQQTPFVGQSQPLQLPVPWLQAGAELQIRREQPALQGVPSVPRPLKLSVPWFGDGLLPYVGEFLSAENYLNREQLLQKIRRGEAVANDVERTVGLGMGERFDLFRKLTALSPKNTSQYGPIAVADKPVQNAAAKQAVKARRKQAGAKTAEETEKEAMRMLTGEDILAELVPEWEQELRSKMLWEGEADRVMDAVREAFRQSDAFIFSRAEDGTVAANPNSGGEWNYGQRFTGELVRLAQENNLSVITKNLKQIVGGDGRQTWSFLRVLKLLSLEGFIASRGVYPNEAFSVSGKRTPTDKLTPEQQAERFLSKGISNTINTGQKADPVIQKMIAFKELGRQRNAKKSPEEYLRLIKAWMEKADAQYPREVFFENGQIIAAAELSREQRMECNLAKGISSAITRAYEIGTENTPVIQELISYKEGGRQNVAPKAPEDYLQLIKEWMAQPGAQYPRQSIYENGALIPAAKMTQDQLLEQALAKGISSAITRAYEIGTENTPAIQELIAYKEAGRRVAARKSPEDYVHLIKEWMAQPSTQYPRVSIYENGASIPPAKMTQEQLLEQALAKGISSAITRAYEIGTENTPAIQELIAYKEAGRRVAARKSPEDYLHLIKEWMAQPGAQYPRVSIYENGGTIPAAKMTHEQLTACNLARGIDRTIRRAYENGTENTPVIQELIAFKAAGRQIALVKSPLEWQRLLLQHLKDFQQYPLSSSSLYRGVYGAQQRRERGPDGRYQDPEVQSLYELDQLARAAKRGEVAWVQVTGKSVAVSKKKRLRISERDEQLRSSRQLFHFYELATEEEKAVLSHVAQTADELRDGFAAWQQQMLSENLIITTNNTVRALNQLQKETNQYQDDERADELDDLLGYLMRGTQLGRQADGSYHRLIFRGERPESPKLDDFHVVREVSGLDNSLAQNVFKATFPSIRFWGDEERIMTLKLDPGASAAQLQQALSGLLPSGFHIRLGTHELGLSGLLLQDKIKFLNGQLHVHFEKSFAKEAVWEEDDKASDASLVVNIDVSTLVQNKSPKAVGQLYQELFGAFMDEKTRNMLRSVR